QLRGQRSRRHHFRSDRAGHHRAETVGRKLLRGDFRNRGSVAAFASPNAQERLLPATSGAGGFGEGNGDFEDREANFKGSSTLRAVVAGDLSLVILDYTVSGAESETGAFADRLGGVERIED